MNDSGAEAQRRGARAAALHSKAFLVLLCGGVCIGFAPVLVRLSDVGPVTSAFWRLCLATPLLWLLVWARGRWRPRAAPPAQRWPLSVWLCGLFFAGDLGVWHISILQTTVANATLLANCAPILVTLYTLVILRQRPSSLFLAALALSMAGAVTLVGPQLQANGSQLRGDLLAFLAACFYTAYMLAIRQARDRYDTLLLMAMTTTITALTLLPVALLSTTVTGAPFWPAAGAGWVVVIALAIVTQCAGQGCIAYALAHLPVTLSTTGLLIQPVVAAAAAWLLFGEHLGPWQFVGAGVLLLGIALARRGSQ